MRRRALRLTLSLPLLLTLGGCQAARLIQRAAAHRVIKVPSAGMAPTINPGDMALVEEGYYRSHPVGRFDIVTFRLSPEHFSEVMEGMDEKAEYVQRVVGLGGETLEIEGGRILVNGRVLEEPFASAPLDSKSSFGPVEIPPGVVFLLGDNRPNSLDGRYWARPTLGTGNIIGRVDQILPQ